MTDKIEDTRKDVDETELARKDAEAGEKLDKILAAMDAMSARIDAFEEEENDKPEHVAADKKKDEDKDEDDKREDGEEDDDKREDGEEDEEAPAKGDARKRKDSPAAKEQRSEEEDRAIKAFESRKNKSDADDEDEEEERKDAHRADSAELRRRIADVEKLLPKQLSDSDHRALSDAQAKADSVFQAFGDSAPRPLMGEDLTSYRRRLASKLKVHSATWKGANIHAVNDAAAFDVIEQSIYADAMSAASSPAEVEPGSMREITTTDRTGRKITTFAGEPSAWMSDFGGHRRRLTGIVR